MKNIDDLMQENKDSQHNLADSGLVKKQDDKQDLKYKFPHTESVNQEKEQALDEKMKELKQKEFEDELRIKAQQSGVGYINLANIPIPADVLSKIDLIDAKERNIICFYYVEHKVARLALMVKDNEETKIEISEIKKEFESKLGVSIEVFFTSAKSFSSAIKLYEALPKIKPPSKGVEISAQDLEKFSGQLNSLSEVKELIRSSSTTELVAVMIAAGLKTEASDIHVEAETDDVKLRYRIDGVLHTAAELDKAVWQKLVSRIKLLSNLKLNITEKPQDGRFSIFLKDEKVDVRVSTLPTNYGESVVMRLLMSKVASLSLEDLGLEENYFKLLKKHISRPNGMIITTGPTGSGKTTTLYAVLNKLNKPETKIITIEDPIEYEIKGINQSQVGANKEYTFAKGLKSIVRQDPDIVMVGEMRDLETVDIALNAALTGHLVLSTLHTNNAAGAIPRFLAMGTKPYLLAPALNLVIAQRLIRKLCDCKKEIQLDENQKKQVQEVADGLKMSLDDIKFYGPTGCEKCNQLGYKGRVGVFEMFEMNKEIEDNILSNQVSENVIKEVAVKNGMTTLTQDGMLKVIKGITSLEEVIRVVGN
ncbi:GspE/PulE family protein [Patescibacteria group bacterium]